MSQSRRLLLVLMAAVTVSACSWVATPSASPVDLMAPSLAARQPAPGEVMDPRQPLRVTFSEPVSGVDAGSFQIADSSGSVLAASVTYDPASRIATLTPASPLPVARSYDVTLAGLIRDAAGNHLPAQRWAVRSSDDVTFAAGIYTGYRFADGSSTFDAIRRMTLTSSSSAAATSFQLIGEQGYLQIADGSLAGFWVHGTPDGTAQDDLSAPIIPLPACDYLDLPVVRANVDGWATTVLDTLYALPTAYVPGDLVDTSQAGLNAGHQVRSLVIVDLTAMVSAAKADGARLAVQSSYRSYASQVVTFDGWVRQVGLEAALRVAARPGHSEHQLGTAIDFRSVNGPSPWTIPDWAVTTEGAWMSANAWRFGWILSFPRDSFEVSCYSYEPWHFRYVGRAIARAIHDAGVSEREWLWAQGYGVR